MDAKYWLQNLKGRDHLEGLKVDRKIKLEWIWWKRMGVCGLDSSGLG
jgi:hypothetical protein